MEGSSAVVSNASRRIRAIVSHLETETDAHELRLNETKANKVQDNKDDYLSLDDLLSASERAIQLKVRDFVNQEIAPVVNDYYEKAEFPFQIVQKFAPFNLMGADIKGYGCPELSAHINGLVAMELAKESVDLATFFCILQNISMIPIYKCGSEEQKQKYLPEMAKLKTVGCFCLTEPEAGSDASGLHSTATKVDGGWLLNGEKTWIGNGTWSDILIIWARNTETKQVNGFIVERKKAAPGTLQANKLEHKIALRSVQNAHIIMKDLFVPDSQRLPKAENWGTGPAQCLFLTRLIASWIAVGAATGAYTACLEYVSKRKQFGTPLSQFQISQEKIVRMASKVQAMRLLSWRASVLYDQGKLTIGQAGMVKAHNSRVGRSVVRLARELVGGNGVITDYKVGRLMADMEGIHTYEGTYEINSLIAAREITGLPSFKPKKQE